MKDNFFLPAIIFVVAVGLIAAYMFAVQNGYAVSRMIDSDYSEVYRGLLVNSYGATDGLIVANGNVNLGSGITTIGRMVANNDVSFNGPWGVTVANNVAVAGNLSVSNWISGDGDNEGIDISNNGNVGIGTTAGSDKLNVDGTISATEMKIGTQNVCRADGTNCPGASLSYVGSCNVITATPCKCNAGETIMLLQSYGFTSAGSSFCRVVNQNSSSVYGERENSNARVCDFACFK